jgi:hypothetical protein
MARMEAIRMMAPAVGWDDGGNLASNGELMIYMTEFSGGRFFRQATLSLILEYFNIWGWGRGQKW